MALVSAPLVDRLPFVMPVVSDTFWVPWIDARIVPLYALDVPRPPSPPRPPLPLEGCLAATTMLSLTE